VSRATRLRYIAITSLDLRIADAAGDFQWGAPSDEVVAFVNDLERDIGTQIYGRKMYETMVFWEDYAPGPTDSPAGIEFARLWRESDKVVFSRSLDHVSSDRTRLEREFTPTVVREMKASADRDLTIGGADLAAQALRFGLVDDIHLFLNPLVIGEGPSALLDAERVELELASVDRLGKGVVHLHYRVGT
jgi:dihydrofolate reductase